jgi:transglutaminase-like putative cysteine protease
MEIRIEHTTTYAYDAPSMHSIQLLRVTPQAFAGQRVGRWLVAGNGRRDLPEIEDAFGNVVHTLTTSEPHDGVTVSVSGVVSTTDTSGMVKGLVETMPVAIYLRDTELTEPDDAIRDLAGTALKDPLETAHQLMAAVRAAVDYRAGTTDIATSAAEALAAGQGVCQDHAHVMIACARVLGIPARYVSGYLASPDGGEVHEASHAWAELRIEGFGWIGFDAANSLCPTDCYVRVAHGLDYQGAAPVNGIRRGIGSDILTVNVEVSPVALQNQTSMAELEEASRS